MWLGVFEAYPGARKVCSQHVMGNSMEISWTMYATRDATVQVRAYYQRQQPRLVDTTGGDFMVRSGKIDVLSVNAKGDWYPTCESRPLANETTVLVVSHATR
jgi:hypothetical protein